MSSTSLVSGYTTLALSSATFSCAAGNQYQDKQRRVFIKELL